MSPTDPSDTTLTGLLAELAADGYDSQMIAETGGRIRCGTCGHHVAASEVEVDRLERLEGASDPADMLAVVALRCPSCDARGAMVLGYGPNATEEDVAVSQALLD